MRHAYLLLPVTLLAACSLISPYTITFTNTPESVIDPNSSTLDFVVSAPTLAYISGVSCENAQPMVIYPVASENTEVSTVHKLPLDLLKDQPSGVLCDITVTAYDKTTTEQSSESILLRMNGIAAATEGAMCGGIAAIPCADGLECVIEDTTIADASGTCSVPTVEQTPVEDGGTNTTVDSTEETVPVEDAAVQEAPVDSEPVDVTTSPAQ